MTVFKIHFWPLLRLQFVVFFSVKTTGESWLREYHRAAGFGWDAGRAGFRQDSGSSYNIRTGFSVIKVKRKYFYKYFQTGENIVSGWSEGYLRAVKTSHSNMV
jgi:hypothetical protein